MFDLHVRAWKLHLENLQMKALLAARKRVETEWRAAWKAIVERNLHG